MSGMKVAKELTVAAPRDHVFKIFTDGIDLWWPREHHIGKSPLKRILIEPAANGRWYSICQDQSEVDVGRVRIWEPPRRVVLSWQINGSWQFDPDFSTEVEVVFESLGPKSTKVYFEHRGLEAYGPATDEIRKAFESPEGWSGILAQFAARAEAAAG